VIALSAGGAGDFEKVVKASAEAEGSPGPLTPLQKLVEAKQTLTHGNLECVRK